MPVDIPLTGGGKRSANVQHWKRKGVEEGAGTSCKSLSLICARMLDQSFSVVLFVCAQIAGPCSRSIYRANEMT